VDVQQTTTTTLAPLLELVRAAATATDRTAFLPFVARAALSLLRADACEVWVDADGPARAATARREGPTPVSLRPDALRSVFADGEMTHTEGWLVVPLPTMDGGSHAAALAVARDGAFNSDEVALVEVAAAVTRMGLDAADAGRMDATARDEFLALLGHDLRSPLSNVRVGSQLAQRNLDAGDLESVRQALKIIESQSGRLLQRLEALLEAVAASGGWLIKLEALDIGAMVSRDGCAFPLGCLRRGERYPFRAQGGPRHAERSRRRDADRAGAGASGRQRGQVRLWWQDRHQLITDG
jgi:signal transduction histidine kinase